MYLIYNKSFAMQQYRNTKIYVARKWSRGRSYLAWNELLSDLIDHLVHRGYLGAIVYYIVYRSMVKGEST